MAQATCAADHEEHRSESAPSPGAEMPSVAQRVEHEAAPASKESLPVPPPSTTPEESAGVASPDSGRGTTCSQSDGGQSEPEPSSQPPQQQQQQQQQQTTLEPDVMAPMLAPVMAEPAMLPMGRPIDYQWLNGHQHHLAAVAAAARVMEPVAINPETGFATVLVDAAAMAGYPHHLPTAGAPWPHHHHAVPGYHHHHHHHHVMQQPPGAHFPSGQPPPPPAHFLHPHAYHEAAMTGEYAAYLASPAGAYDPTLLAAPGAYDPSALYDPASIHLASNGHLPGYAPAPGKPAQRRPNRGSSVSPKRPGHRSSSQQSQPPAPTGGPATTTSTSGSCGRRTSVGLGSAPTGRYTPSPSARSRGSSPGQHSAGSAGATGAGPANPPPSADQHVVHLHVNPGETISFQMDGQVQVIQGPATVRMVSTGSPPVPLPVQVPPGHVLHQIVDERGTLRHVILSPAPAAASGPHQAPGPAYAAATGPGSGAAVGVLPLATPTHPPPPPPHYAPPPASSGSSTSSPPHYFASNGTGASIGAYHHHHHHHQPGQQPRPAPTSSPSSYHPGLGHRPAGGAAGNSVQQSTHATYNMSSAHSSSGKGPSPPSPTSSPSFASERAQRQAAKLRKKLESRSSKGGAHPASLSSNDTPPSSPKKDNNNIRKLKDRNQNGPGDAAAPNEDHVDGGDGQGVRETLASRITDLKPPQVSDIESRSVSISWEPVETVITEPNEAGDSTPDISYEATVGLKRANPDRPSTYRGKECHFRFNDLQPGSDYWVRVSALADEIKVKEAAVVEFRTEACPPDTPLAPKLQNRTRNTLVMRWAPPNDNGSPIGAYVLECDDGTGGEQFAEVYRGRAKQFTIGKLQSSTCYAIRLAACNEVGTSAWSDICRVTTMGAPPPPPCPPSLVSASAKQMSLSWAAVSPDMLYTLQMADPLTGHGFLNVYHGPDNEHACTGLMRSTTYRFRLQAQNDDGTSRWSEEASFSTTPDRPAAPARPSVKGRIQSHGLRVRWDPPSDSGGAAVQQYTLELDSGSGFGHLWTGPECEFSCERLTPGTTYRLRVACSNGHELSDYSEPLIVTTEPVCPAAPAAPTVAGKAKSTSLQLKWERPSHDGGSMVTQYEVNMTAPDGGERIVFSGFETECLVASLLPGRTYSFQVRASNRIGFGPWSDSLEAKSGPGVPEAPGAPQAAHRSSHSLALTWSEPCNNGALIGEYRLEMAHHPRQQMARSPSNGSISTADSAEASGKTTPVMDESIDVDLLSFALCHSGTTRQFEVKGLQPWSTYHFRVQAANAVGHSAYSPVACFSTLASSPAAVTGLRLVSSTTTSLSLSWNAPSSNGSPITHYNIELGDKGLVSTSDPATTYDLEHLTPDTTYRIRVQAANAIGVGSFSGTAKFSTRPLPPEAPRIECAQFGHNSLKLRWGDSKKPDFLSYTLEMREEGSDRFYLVHEGPGQSCRVSKLSESTTYTFRICARNDVGEGPYSDEVTFQTTRAPPPALKKLDILELTETSCHLVWSAARPPAPSDNIVYHVEVTRTKDHHQIMSERYAESDASLDNLDPQTEYSIRVCPIRICEGGDITGTPFPSKTFTTLAIPVKSAANSGKAATSLLSSFQVAGKAAAVPSLFNRLWSAEQMPLFCTGFFLILCVLITILISTPHFRSSAP